MGKICVPLIPPRPLKKKLLATMGTGVGYLKLALVNNNFTI